MSGSLPPGQQAYNGQQMVPGAMPMQYALNGAHQMSPNMNGQFQQARPLPSPQFYAQPLPPHRPQPTMHAQHLPNPGAMQHAQARFSPQQQPQPHQVHQPPPHQQHQQHPSPQRFQHQALPPLQHQLQQQHQHQQQHPQQQQPSPQPQMHQFPMQRSNSIVQQSPNGAFHFQQSAVTASSPIPAPMSIPLSSSSPLATPVPLPSQMQFMPQPVQQVQQVQQRYTQPQVVIPAMPLSMYPNNVSAPLQQQQPLQQHQPRQQQQHQPMPQSLPQPLPQSLPPSLPQPQIPQHQHQQQQHQAYQQHQQHNQQQHHANQQHQFQQPQPSPQYQPTQLAQPAQHAHQVQNHQPVQRAQGSQTPQPTQMTAKVQQASQFPLPSPSPQQIPRPIPPPMHAQARQGVPATPSPPIPSPLPQHQKLQKPSPRISPKGAVQKTQKSQHQHPRKASVSSVARSPSVVQKRSPADTAALLVCVADDCLAKAQEAAPGLANTKDEAGLREYYKLMATALGCLDTALRSYKFPPRIEVKMKIRYASLLSEETENLMEAETALQAAIATCEKHRLLDLKLYVQFLFMKVLFRRKPKAALISIQTHISECSDRRQTYWTYAFRFLKALFYLQSGNPAETHALENLHGISTLAEQRGDRAVYILANLLQALALFRTTETDVIERVQTCMAAASKYQLEESAHIPQLDILWLLLDLACSLYHREKSLTEKLNALQAKLEEWKESPLWATDSTELVLPLKKDAAGVQTVSDDTGDILRPGDDTDYLVLTSFSKITAFILGFAFSGLTLSPKQQNSDKKSMDYWAESLKMLSQSGDSKPSGPRFLQEAVDDARWRASTTSYVLVLMGLNAATRCDWEKVQECIRNLETPIAESDDKPMEVLSLYLKGVMCQGTGELNDALEIFENPVFDLDSDRKPASSNGLVRQEIMLLAAMNRLMIMQLIRLRDEPKINLLVEQLKQHCISHSNPEIKTAYSLVMAAITIEPPLSMQDIKSHIQQGLNGSTASSNAQCLNIALNTMRYRLFDNVVGEQALKSARAGSTQAKKSGNILWMSVADGMLAETYEVQGQTVQAQISRQAGIQYANDSWQRTQV